MIVEREYEDIEVANTPELIKLTGLTTPKVILLVDFEYSEYHGDYETPFESDFNIKKLVWFKDCEDFIGKEFPKEVELSDSLIEVIESECVARLQYEAEKRWESRHG